MMTNDTAARHVLDRNGRLHRQDGTFATREETAAYLATFASWLDFTAAACLVATARMVSAVRRFTAPETRPERAPRLLWKSEERLQQQARLWGFTD